MRGVGLPGIGDPTPRMASTPVSSISMATPLKQCIGAEGYLTEQGVAGAGSTGPLVPPSIKAVPLDCIGTLVIQHADDSNVEVVHRPVGGVNA